MYCAFTHSALLFSIHYPEYNKWLSLCSELQLDDAYSLTASPSKRFQRPQCRVAAKWSATEYAIRARAQTLDN